jgi:hypothetical protein
MFSLDYYLSVERKVLSASHAWKLTEKGLKSNTVFITEKVLNENVIWNEYLFNVVMKYSQKYYNLRYDRITGNSEMSF